MRTSALRVVSWGLIAIGLVAAAYSIVRLLTGTASSVSWINLVTGVGNVYLGTALVRAHRTTVAGEEKNEPTP